MAIPVRFPNVSDRQKHHARMIMPENKKHVDSRGVEQDTHPGNPAHIGPNTMVLISGQPLKSFKDHMKENSPTFHRIASKSNPHPVQIGLAILKKNLDMGKPHQETAAEERAEIKAGTETEAEEKADLARGITEAPEPDDKVRNIRPNRKKGSPRLPMVG